MTELFSYLLSSACCVRTNSQARTQDTVDFPAEADFADEFEKSSNGNGPEGPSGDGSPRSRTESSPSYGCRQSPGSMSSITTTSSFQVDDVCRMASFKEGAEQHSYEGDRDELMTELEMLAQRLQRRVQKYPKNGKTFFRRAQDRFIAVMPRALSGRGSSNTTPLRAPLECWRAGRLLYWESEAAWRQNADPKGYVPLLRIAKVHHVCKDKNGCVLDGCTVKIRHKELNEKEATEFEILFPSYQAAQEWSYVLWLMISKLRQQS
eukprot:gnl/TRDRNA2_/TRDRNA2_190600_c0_seq1.p1 gnl/TRDRNA2_/TRDRNA2_190600_c0~~gnl/TRDRNA2_/TRDRNA2_190600_c0_seq1.p1  ORF type:complete len:264 (+),score=48.21 gnl/TRDRNA2_/TRDRNA2_190600_c0_seq1:69-860(+)